MELANAAEIVTICSPTNGNTGTASHRGGTRRQNAEVMPVRAKFSSNPRMAKQLTNGKRLSWGQKSFERIVMSLRI